MCPFQRGCPGSRSDGGVFKEDRLGSLMGSGEFKHIPPPDFLPGDEEASHPFYERIMLFLYFIVEETVGL